MKTNETNEDNKLIAEFMGWEEQTDPTERWFGSFRDTTGILHKNTPTDPLLFHASWDWLMPVIKEIDGIANEEMSFAEFDDYPTQWAMIDKPSKCPLERVCNQVVEFIKWYNKNLKQAQD